MKRTFSEFKKSNGYHNSSSKMVTKASNKPETLVRGLNSSSSSIQDEMNANILNTPENVTKNSKKDPVEKTPKVEQVIKDEKLYPPKNEKVNIYGKVAKFPKNVKASQAYNFMNNIKDPKLAKKDIWYLMVEKQDNELQLIKYHQKEGVNLTRFVYDLKTIYTDQYKDFPKVAEAISKVDVGGDEEGKVSMIKNIPNIVVDTKTGKKLIQKITEDLIVLLS